MICTCVQLFDGAIRCGRSVGSLTASCASCDKPAAAAPPPSRALPMQLGWPEAGLGGWLEDEAELEPASAAARARRRDAAARAPGIYPPQPRPLPHARLVQLAAAQLAADRASPAAYVHASTKASTAGVAAHGRARQRGALSERRERRRAVEEARARRDERRCDAAVRGRGCHEPSACHERSGAPSSPEWARRSRLGDRHGHRPAESRRPESLITQRWASIAAHLLRRPPPLLQLASEWQETRLDVRATRARE